MIAKRNSTAFYVIRRSDGRVCYSASPVSHKVLTPAQKEEATRFNGSTGCIDPSVFPSRAMPVLNYSFYAYRPGDREYRLVGLQGFAAAPVARIGVIGRDKQIVFSVPVVHNVYTSGKKGIAGGRGIVALDKNGKVLWVQCTAIGTAPDPHFPSGGCGKYKNSPPPNVPPVAQPTRPVKPVGPVIVQRGTGDGVDVVVRGAQIEMRFSGISPATLRLLENKQGRINVGCINLVTVGGKQEASATGITVPFRDVVRTRIWNLGGMSTAPFDGCTATGTYGRNWNDGRGTHDAVEIPLTPRGRRFFTERATARDLAWLARARVFQDIRYTRLPLSTDEVARRLGSKVVPLASAHATPPAGKLGVWIGSPKRIVLVERATTGRRLSSRSVMESSTERTYLRLLSLSAAHRYLPRRV